MLNILLVNLCGSRLPISGGQPDQLRRLSASPGHPHLLGHKTTSTSSKARLDSPSDHGAAKHHTLTQQLRDAAEQGQKVGERCCCQLGLRRRMLALSLTKLASTYLMICMLAKQERESVPQTSPSHNCQYCFESEHIDASLMSRVNQLLHKACQSLPLLPTMASRLSRSPPSSGVELPEKIAKLCGVEARGRIREAVVGEDRSGQGQRNLGGCKGLQTIGLSLSYLHHH